MSNIYICECEKGHKISKEAVEKWKSKLKEKKASYTIIEDLCGTVVNNKSVLQDINDENNPVFFACQPKAVENLLKTAGVRAKSLKFHHIENTDVAILNKMEINEGEISTIKYSENWKPWYPVIDYSLCTSCQKCLNFCLFGVFKLNDDGEVEVEKPSNCKDFCPACARTCPPQAIIFPKHHESPIDGGEGKLDVLDGKDLISEIQKSENVYKILSNRRKASGISLLKVDQMKLAEEERACCCNKEKK